MGMDEMMAMLGPVLGTIRLYGDHVLSVLRG